MSPPFPAGITAEQVAAAAASIQLRSGCSDTLTAAAAAGLPVSLLSVNWSKTLINKAMGCEQQQLLQAEVFSNELEFGLDAVSTGQLQRQVQCGRDKLGVLRGLVRKHQTAAAAAAAGGGPVVYVGDSCSDILPLVEVSRVGCVGWGWGGGGVGGVRAGDH
jgi:2-hydroxy-3-keto-5-methylthiopentenyl-1-phosphate phosphatase